MRAKSLLLVLGFGLAIIAVARPAEASICTITTTSNIVFGNYDVYGSSPVDTTGGVSITCIAGGSIALIYINLSTGGSGSFSQRYMVSQPTRQLNYNLYLDAARTTIWGDNTGGSSHGGSYPGSTSVTIYGRIPSGQDAWSGSYTDSIVATVTF